MSVRRRSVTGRLAEQLRQEKGHHATTRGLFEARGRALVIADAQIGELRLEIEQLKAERDRLARLLWPHGIPEPQKDNQS